MSGTYRGKEHDDRRHLAPIGNATDLHRWHMVMSEYMNKSHSGLIPYWEFATSINNEQRENAQFFIDQYLLKEATKNHC